MAFRSDLTVNFELSPRIVTVAAPSVALSVQDLHDTLTDTEDTPEGAQHANLILSAGKEELGAGVTVGITSELQNIQVAFESRTTPLETGTVTTPDALGITLTDTTALFQTNLVGRGDIVYNNDDGSSGTVLSVTSETVLVMTALTGGTDDQWDSADAYSVYDEVQCELSGGNVVAVDDMSVEMDPIFTTFGTQVIRTSSSSATLQELEDIQHASFDGAIHVDVVGGTAGVTYPAGNTANPVDNLSDAAAINVLRGFDRYNIVKSMTLTSVATWQDAVFVGHSIIDTVLHVDDDADVTKTEFLTCSLEGSMGDTTILRDCFLGETNVLTDVRGVIEDCSIGPATITLGGALPNVVRFVDCRGAGLDLAPPTIDCNGDGPEVDIQGYIGQLNIRNKTGTSNFEISISGKLTLDATVTGGIVIVNGTGTLVDNSAPSCTVVDNMVHGVQLSEMYTGKGLDIDNVIQFTPNRMTSADGDINVAINRQQSHMDYGNAVTETRTRLAPSTVAFEIPFVFDLLPSTGVLVPTFTRASAGSFVSPSTSLVTTGGTNVARLEAAGVLIEESRENLCLRSEEFEHAAWVQTRASVSANAAVAPDGLTTADELVEDGSTGTHLNDQVFTKAASALPYAVSVYAKANTRSKIAIRMDDGSSSNVAVADFNLSNGLIQAPSTIGAYTNFTQSVKPLANGWYRCTVRATVDTGTTLRLRIQLVSGSARSYSGDGTSGAYLWGGQVEQALKESSYIATVGTAVTRSGDFLSYDDDTLLLDTAGSLFAEITPLFGATQANDAVIVNIANQLIGPMYITDDTTQKIAIGDGTNTSSYDPTFAGNALFRVATRWNDTDNEIQAIAAGVSGTVSAYDSAFARSAGTIYVGSDGTGNHINGNIRNLICYNADRTESQLKIDTG